MPRRSTLSRARGTAALRRDGRARRAAADPARLEALDATVARGRAVRPARRRRGRGPGRQDPRRRHQPVRQPGRVPGRDDGARAERRRLDRRGSTYPAPADFASAEAWVDALFAGESARGPRHGAEPAVEYASLWTLWLSALPYGLWSEHDLRARAWRRTSSGSSGSSMRCRRRSTTSASRCATSTTVADLACACASLIEGAWLNQCLTLEHPLDPSEPIATALRRSGRLLWRGATA